MIKIGDDSVDLSKKRCIRVHMIFQRDKKTRTSYQTPYGSLMLGFDSKMIRVLESEDMIHLNLEYDLEVEEEHLAECFLTLKVQAKQRDSLILSQSPTEIKSSTKMYGIKNKKKYKQ